MSTQASCSKFATPNASAPIPQTQYLHESSSPQAFSCTKAKSLASNNAYLNNSLQVGQVVTTSRLLRSPLRREGLHITPVVTVRAEDLVKQVLHCINMPLAQQFRIAHKKLRAIGGYWLEVRRSEHIHALLQQVAVNRL